MMNDIYKTTVDRLRAALSAEWCDLYGHKFQWSAAVDKAWDEEEKAFKAANDAEDTGEEEGKVDALYDIAQAMYEEYQKQQERVDRLEKAMELIEQLQTLYADDWKEV